MSISINAITRALDAGVIVNQYKGSAPDAEVGVVGGIALDTKDGAVYNKSEGGWTKLAVNLGATGPTW